MGFAVFKDLSPLERKTFRLHAAAALMEGLTTGMWLIHAYFAVKALGATRRVPRVKGVASPESILNQDDLMVVYGSNRDIQKFLKEESE